MSLWWRDSVRVRLAPDALRVEHRRRGLRSVAGEVFEEPVAPVSGDVPAWTTAVDALERCLQSPRFRGADVDVALSGAFVRWLLLPWSAALATDSERLAYAALEFEAVHGERARGWRIRLSDGRPGEPSPACAIDEALAARLESAAVAVGGRLIAAQPAFSAALDRHRHALTAPGAAFAHIESGRCTIAAFERGQWRHLDAGRVSGRVSEALGARLARVDALGVCPDAPRRVHVVFDDVVEALPARLGGWDVVTPGDATGAAGPRFAWGRS